MLHEGRMEIREKLLRQKASQEDVVLQSFDGSEPRVVGDPQRDIQVMARAFSARIIAVTCEEPSRPSSYLAVLAIASPHVALMPNSQQLASETRHFVHRVRHVRILCSRTRTSV